MSLFCVFKCVSFLNFPKVFRLYDNAQHWEVFYALLKMQLMYVTLHRDCECKFREEFEKIASQDTPKILWYTK